VRALRDTIGEADAPDRWQAFLLDTIRLAPMPDFLLYGEPYPCLNAVALARHEHRQLVEVTETFARIFEKAAAALAGDGAALERLGFPWVAAELLRLEQPAAPPILGRFDFLLDRRERWQLLEYNADTPSGARETVVVEPLIVHHLGSAGSVQRDGRSLRGTAGTLRLALVGAVRAALAATIPRPGGAGGGSATGRVTCGIMTDAGYNEDLAQGVFLARTLGVALAPDGVDLVLGDVDNLYLSRGRLMLYGRPLAALYRYYPFESLLGQQAFADLFTAVSTGRVQLLNGLTGLLVQNKGVLAWLWEHRDDPRFSVDERRAIREHLPPVYWIDAMPESLDRRRCVLKQVFGREGEEVYFGDAISAEDWERCRAWGSYVVQERVDAEPFPAVVRTSRGPEVRSVWAAVGSFTARSRWAGYYTRLDAPITTAHAKFVATVVE
jgi:glutathionylspermidine synthase